MRRITTALLALSLFATANAEYSVPGGKYVLENTHGYITFSYSHLGFSTPHIGFDSFDVSLDTDPKNIESSQVSVTIDAASINSRVDEFDKHLNGSDFFDTANHGEISFTSTSVKTNDDGTLSVTGDLTIKDVTKPITLATTINKAANHPMRKVPTIGVSASGTLSRGEWGLGKYAPAVGDEVTLYITVELIKAD